MMHLLLRSKDPYDKAIPSGNGMAAHVLVRLKEKRYHDIAKRSFEAFLPLMHRAPRGTESLILALARYYDDILTQSNNKQVDSPDARIRQSPLTIELFASHLKIAPGKTLDLAIRIAMDPGWHINSNAPLQDYLKPTEVYLNNNDNIILKEIIYPKGQEIQFSFSPEPLSVYQDEVLIYIPVTFADNIKEGTHRIELELKAQPCNDETCQAPQTISISLPIEIKSEAVDTKPRHHRIFKNS